MGLMNGVRKLLAALAVLGLAAGPATAAEREARPALWRLSDADTTIYLFGTIHVLPPELRWRTPRLDEVIRTAGELVLEADFRDQQADAQVMMRLAMSPGLPRLVERVPQERRAALQAMVERSGFPAQVLDSFESWAAAMFLLYASVERLGLSPSSGVEEVLRREFAGRPISGLNTVEEQLGFLDGLSQQAQTEFLASVAEDIEEGRREIDEMITAWASGDPEAIEDAFDDESETSEEFRQVLLVRRNQMWTAWLANRLDRPGTILVAVGAGHLAGPDSVNRMLASRGLRLERVQ